jgi:hypothetical protein
MFVWVGSSICGKWPVSAMISTWTDGMLARSMSRYGVVWPLLIDRRSRFSSLEVLMTRVALIDPSRNAEGSPNRAQHRIGCATPPDWQARQLVDR